MNLRIKAVSWEITPQAAADRRLMAPLSPEEASQTLWTVSSGATGKCRGLFRTLKLLSFLSVVS